MASVNLNRTVREFKDLDLNFTIHPIKKDINKLINDTAIINAVKNIILTNHYEKPFNPDYGSNVRKLLFENYDVATSGAIQNEIRQCLTNFEPRITVIDVIVIDSPDTNSFDVTIVFSLKNVSEPITINFLLQRLR